MTSYDQALEAMSREQLVVLCHHQGEQVTRLLRERVACAGHEERIAELEDIIERQNRRLRGKGAA